MFKLKNHWTLMIKMAEQHLNNNDIEAIKALNFLRISKSNLRSWLLTGLVILAFIIIGPIWNETTQDSTKSIGYWEYLKRVRWLFLIGLTPTLPWLIDILLKKIEITFGTKKVLTQRIISKRLIGFFKVLRFEGGQFIIYRRSVHLQKFKSGDLVHATWTGLNRLINYEIIESEILTPKRPN